MSILRYGASDIDVYPGQKDGEYVKYEDHIVELTALREELAQAKRTAITEIEALHRTMYRQSTELAAAEQRNAELCQTLKLAVGRAAKKWFYESFDDDLLELMQKAGLIAQAEGFSLSVIATLQLDVETAIDAALKPAESGASDRAIRDLANDIIDGALSGARE